MVAKLFSALTYLFILIFASIPLTAVVFVFGGVAPDDVVRGYVVLVTTAIGLGSVGLFFSALLKRTHAATIVTYFGVLVVTAGSLFTFYFWNSMTGGGGAFDQGFGPIKGRPPEALVYLNPYFAQADILCGVENGFGQWCKEIAFVTDRPAAGGFITGGGSTAPGGGFALPDPGVEPPVRDAPAGVEVVPFGVVRDTFWPKSAISWLVLSLILIFASVQLVTPTRRWRLPGFLRRSTRRIHV